MAMVQSTRKIIEHWPSANDLADDLSRILRLRKTRARPLSRKTVYGWLYRGSIRAGYWRALLQSAEDRELDITIDDLLDAAEDEMRHNERQWRS